MDNDDVEDKLNKAGQWASDVASQAVNKLTHMEHGAVKSGYNNKSSNGSAETSNGSDDSTQAAKNRENNPDSSFINNVSKNQDDKKEGRFGFGKGASKSRFSGELNATSKLKTAWKKGGPAGVFLAILALAMMFLGFGSQSLMFAAIPAQFQRWFDSQSVSSDARQFAFMQKKLSDPGKTPTKAKMFGGDKFKISKKEAEKLAKQGIRYEEIDVGGKKVKTLAFDDGFGTEPVRVVANDKDMSRLKGGGYDFVETHTKMMLDSTDYRNGMNTVYGSKKLWYDTKTANFLKKFKLTRSLFSDYITDVEQRQKGNTKSEALNKIADNAQGDAEMDVNLKTSDAQNESEMEKSKIQQLKEKVSLKIGKNNPTRIQARQAIEDFSNKWKSKTRVSGIAGLISNIGCGVAAFAGAIKIMVVAYQMNQFMQLATSVLSAFDQVKAGEGNEAAHDLLNTLTEPRDTTYYPDYAQDTQKVARTNVSAMESQGMGALFDNTMAVDQNDVSVKNVNAYASFNDQNFLGSLISGLSSLSLTIAGFTACTNTKVVTAAIDTAIDVGAGAACVGSLLTTATGVGAPVGIPAAIISCGVELFSKIGGTIALSLGIGAALAFVVPKISDWAFATLAKTTLNSLVGEDLGNALVAGGHDYLGKNHRYGGGALATEAKYDQFAKVQAQVIADRAEYDRTTKSPFDISSQYTFLGSLAYQFARWTTQSSNKGVLSTLGNALRSSTTALMSPANAENNSNVVVGNCPDLEAIGAVGDAYCNPYIMTDPDTINTDPVDIVDTVDNLHGLTDKEGDVPEIAKSSNLAKYVYFCENRTSPFGIVDQNFVDAISSDEWKGEADTSTSLGTSDNPQSLLKTGVYSVPVVGDITGMMEDTNALANLPWISGQACTASEGNTWWNNEIKYYQRFEEDQRLAQGLGMIEKTSSDIFMEEYEQRHPLDNSLEGVIAQQTGMKKDQVTETLAYIEEMNFLANYDPSDLGPLVAEPQNTEMPDFTSSNVIATMQSDSPTYNSTNLAQHFIVYSDLRTRTQVA